MRIMIFTGLIAALPFASHAQMETFKKNEIGVMGEVPLSDGPTTTIALKYNRWNEKNVGYHIVAGYSNYYTQNYGHMVAYTPDTAIHVNKQTNINMAIAGGGIDAQRRLFHKVFVYASLELRLGFGTGYEDSVVTKYYHFSQPGETIDYSYSNTAGSRAATLFYVGFTPAIGAKIVFKRIVVGTEINNLATYTNISVNNVHTTQADFSSSAFNQRVFVQYRF